MASNTDSGGESPGIGSHVTVKGGNSGSIQSIAGHDISNVSQVTGAHGAAETPDVQTLLASFREELDRNEAKLQDDVDMLRTIANRVDAQLAANERTPSALRRMAATLAAAVTGTVVQDAGDALSQAIGNLLN